MIIILYHTHFHYRIITPCYLIGTRLHLGDCKIAIIMSLFIRLISCWNTPKNAGNNLSELQEIQNFKKKKGAGACPQTPLHGSHLQWSTRLSQNASYGPDLLAYDVYLLVKPCIYMLVAAVIQTCRLELLQVPR
jgi:hypothetical protein